jgi:hypothetical protein
MPYRSGIAGVRSSTIVQPASGNGYFVSFSDGQASQAGTNNAENVRCVK